MSTTVFYLNSWLKLHSDLWDTEIQEFNFTDHESGKRAWETEAQSLYWSTDTWGHAHPSSFQYWTLVGFLGYFPAHRASVSCCVLILYYIYIVRPDVSSLLFQNLSLGMLLGIVHLKLKIMPFTEKWWEIIKNFCIWVLKMVWSNIEGE